MRIATYNIKNDGPVPDELDNWNYRKDNIKELIRFRNWDIVGLQEVTESQKGFFLSLSDYQFIGNIRDQNIRSEYNPIIFKRDKFDVKKSGTNWLSKTPDIESKDWGAACTRIFTWAELIEKDSGKTILFICTHFDHISKLARNESAELLIKFIKEMGSINVVLVGDFNANETEKYYTKLTSELVDVRKQAEHYVGPDVTCTGIDFSHELNWSDMQSIDYIFVNHQIRIEKTEVVTDKFKGRYSSDHFPVESDILIE